MSAEVERYRLYVDESGDHVIHDRPTLEQEGHRYLALVGCWMTQGSEYVSFHRSLDDLKQRHFPHNPDDPVILHRKDIVTSRGPFWRLRDAEARSRFDEELLQVIDEVHFHLVGVVIDKLELFLQYVCPRHPYHLAVDFLLQRYCFWLNHLNRQGDVMAESRGGAEDRRLQDAYQDIWDRGDFHHDAEFFQRCLTSRKPKLKKKSDNIAGLQLADLLAHPVRRHVLLQKRHSQHPESAFERRLFKILQSKFNRHIWEDRVEGYGWVLFPK